MEIRAPKGKQQSEKKKAKNRRRNLDDESEEDASEPAQVDSSASVVESGAGTSPGRRLCIHTRL